MSHVNIVSTGHSNVPLVAGQIDHGRRDVVLRPDHRAGGPGAGRAQRHPPHDRRGPPDGRLGRAAAPAVPRLARGDLGQHAGDERGDPAGRRVDHRRGRGPHQADPGQAPRIESTLVRVDDDDRAGAGHRRREPRERPADDGLGPRPDRLAHRRRRQGPRQGRTAARRPRRDARPLRASALPGRPDRRADRRHPGPRPRPRSNARSPTSAMPPTGATSWCRRSTPTRSS